MTFKTKSQALEVSTKARLCELLDASLGNRERFMLEKGRGHSLSVEAYEDECLVLELHRGKKWEGWLSASTKMEDAKAIFDEYYDEPLITSQGIEKRRQWGEVAAFHPAVYIIGAVLLTILVVWTTWFRH